MWIFVATAALAVACVFQTTQPTPAPSPSPTIARPRFEITSFMYALQVKGKIRVGVLDRDAPFATTDAGGKHSGFEPDLAREIAKSIFGPAQPPDSVIEWISVDRSTAISAVTSSQADIVLARMVRNESGAGQPPGDFAVATTGPYFETGERILVTKANDEIKDLADLEAKTVCVTNEATAAHVDDANPFAKTLQLDTNPSCLAALKAGQVDAIASDEATLWSLMKQDADTKLVGRNLTTERYVIGMKKNESGDRNGILPFVDTWLNKAIRDGTWGRIYAHNITPFSGEQRTAP
jgi:glutamate transport system substrate-binding protein